MPVALGEPGRVQGCRRNVQSAASLHRRFGFKEGAQLQRARGDVIELLGNLLGQESVFLELDVSSCMNMSDTAVESRSERPETCWTLALPVLEAECLSP